MQVTSELIDHLAHLSYLRFDGAEKEAIRQDLEKMIGFIEKLQALDTTGVEPLRHMGHAVNQLREDEQQGTISREEALKNAAHHTAEFFLVPKVLKK